MVDEQEVSKCQAMDEGRKRGGHIPCHAIQEICDGTKSNNDDVSHKARRDDGKFESREDPNMEKPSLLVTSRRRTWEEQFVGMSKRCSSMQQICRRIGRFGASTASPIAKAKDGCETITTP